MEAIKEISLAQHQCLINPLLSDYNNEELKGSGKEKRESKRDNRMEKSNKAKSSKQNDKNQDEVHAEEHLYDNMCLDLPLYQDKIKRDKDLYKEEFLRFLKVFIPKFNEFLESPATNHPHIKEILVFLAHLSHVFPKDLAFLPTQLKLLLEHSHTVIHPETRLAIIETFNLLRKKSLIEPIDILPLFFQLLTCQDKILRQKLQENILTDLQRINEKAKNHKVNKYIRNKCSDMLLNPNYKAARKTLNIMILLYKKKVWNDDKTVNAIANACYSKDSKIAYSACKFFLSEFEEIDEESDNEELGELKQKYKLLGKGNNKKTKKRKEKLKTLMKAVERRETRKQKIKVNKDFMPIDLINDPTSLCERMFDRIKHVKLRKHMKLKTVLLRLIGRICGRHKIVVPHFFSFCATLIRPRTDDLETHLAAIVEATHHMVSQSDLIPVINELFDNFICESFPALNITIGINTLKELVERSPNVITYPQFTAATDLKKVKNKSVSTAVRAFINLVRDVNPELLDGNVKDSAYAETSVPSGIIGVDLLKINEGLPKDYNLECNQLLTDKQLRKLKLLKMKDNAEAVQRIRLNLSGEDVDGMLGEKRERKDLSKKETLSASNLIKREATNYKSIVQNKKLKHSNKETKLSLKENEGEEEDIEEEEEEEEGDEIDDENASDLSDESSILDMEDAESYYSNDEEEKRTKDNLVDNEVEEEENEEEDLDEDELDEDEEEEEDDELDSKEQAKQELDVMLESQEEEGISESDGEDSNSFVDENQINTYKLTFKEKRGMLQNEDKEEFKLKRKKKQAGQKTNYEARKNKPLQMVIHKVKRKKLKENDKNLTKRIKNVKRQLGRFKRGNMILNKKGVDKKTTKKKLSKKNKKRKV